MSKPSKETLAPILRYMEAHPGKTAFQVRHNLSRFKVLAKDVQAAATQCGYEFATVSSGGPRKGVTDPGGGLTLTGKNLMSHKPADSAKVHLMRLPKGKAFILTELAAKVGVSAETLKRHAKNLKCLLYMETAPGEWQQVVLNPETAKEYAP